MATAAENAHLDQLTAASRHAVADVAARYADVAASLRAQIADGSIMRVDAIRELRVCWDLTEVGAEDILDRAGLPGFDYPRHAVTGLPPLTAL